MSRRPRHSPAWPRLAALVLRNAPASGFVLSAGVEILGVVGVLALGDGRHMGRPGLLVVDKSVTRLSFRFVTAVLVDARVEEDGGEG